MKKSAERLKNFKNINKRNAHSKKLQNIYHSFLRFDGRY